MEREAKIYVAGHRGMVGSAIVRQLKANGFEHWIGATSAELDLREQRAVFQYFEAEQPDYVFLAAAKVGGILANNTQRAEFLYDNLMIQANIIEAAYRVGVKKLLFLGSSCIYPKLAPQPIPESALLTAALEPTNEPYAIAKIAGIKLCEAYRDQYGCHFISAMPTNLYGPGDNFDLETSHVLPALLRKFHEAKLANAAAVTLWGSGSPRREFMHVDDLAAACLHLMNHYDGREWINVGVGEDLTILELAELIRDVVGYTGDIVTDPTKPDGTPRKLLDVSKLKASGFEAKIPLKQGIQHVYGGYCQSLTTCSSKGA